MPKKTECLRCHGARKVILEGDEVMCFCTHAGVCKGCIQYQGFAPLYGDYCIDCFSKYNTLVVSGKG